MASSHHRPRAAAPARATKAYRPLLETLEDRNSPGNSTLGLFGPSNPLGALLACSVLLLDRLAETRPFRSDLDLRHGAS